MKKSIYAPWLISFYRWYWREKYGYSAAREDFCHFGRVVFFWAPLYWFTNRRMIGGLKPWMFMVGALWGASLAYYPPFAILVALLIALAILARRLTTLAGKALNQKIGWKAVKVWQVLLVALIILGLALYTKVVVEMLLALSLAVGLMVGLLLVCALAMVAILIAFSFGMVGLDWLLDWMDRWPVPEKAAEPVEEKFIKNAYRDISGALSTGWHWLVVLKRKTICPWVSFNNGRIEFLFSPDESDD